MKDYDTKNDNEGAWINFYKLPDKEIYWSGAAEYLTKEAAQLNSAGERYRIATLNIKEVINQQAEINRLREALKKIILYAPGCYNTAECPLNVGGGFDNMCGYKCAFVIAHKALNGESEVQSDNS